MKTKLDHVEKKVTKLKSHIADKKEDEYKECPFMAELEKFKIR